MSFVFLSLIGLVLCGAGPELVPWAQFVKDRSQADRQLADLARDVVNDMHEIEKLNLELVILAQFCLVPHPVSAAVRAASEARAQMIVATQEGLQLKINYRALAAQRDFPSAHFVRGLRKPLGACGLPAPLEWNKATVFAAQNSYAGALVERIRQRSAWRYSHPSVRPAP